MDKSTHPLSHLLSASPTDFAVDTSPQSITLAYSALFASAMSRAIAVAATREVSAVLGGAVPGSAEAGAVCEANAVI